MDHKQALEIQVATIQKVKRTRLYGQVVQGVDLVSLAIGTTCTVLFENRGLLRVSAVRSRQIERPDTGHS
jgi:hypothetical protein